MKKFKPDLVLLDIWMSGTDGRDICRQIKADPKLKKTPVIMISASKDVISSSKEAGADGFIAKPFEMDHLLSTVAKFSS
jgi:CheY-like chemotaxis protein